MQVTGIDNRPRTFNLLKKKSGEYEKYQHDNGAFAQAI